MFHLIMLYTKNKKKKVKNRKRFSMIETERIWEIKTLYFISLETMKSSTVKKIKKME